MKTSTKGIELIKSFEGYRGVAYKCPAGVWTVGYGTTLGVKEGDTMSLSEATSRLVTELHGYEQGVSEACTLKPTQSQFDALVCLAYNIGIAGFKKSTVVKRHNAGDFQAAANAFTLWNKVSGKPMAGLTRRRNAEASLYLTHDAPYGFPVEEAMPQAVDAERPMTASTINRASVVAGGTASIAAVSQTINTINEVKDGVQSLGSWFVPLLLVAVVGLCGFIIWQRYDMRSKGLA